MAVVGQVIDDKYEILKLVGQGGMSKVYLAMDKRLNKSWAVKEIEKRVKDKNNEVVVQSAIAEANMIKQLDHPAIVRIVDIIDNGNVIYIIEDFIQGETLETLIDSNEGKGLPQDMVVDWALQLCDALEYLHGRTPPIIYRDMKPANVMLTPEGAVRVIDFGIAREYKGTGRAGDTVSLGTKGYAAPEQFGGKGETDARTDIYCLGVTLHHLLTGNNPCDNPFDIKPIRQYNPQLDEGLEAVIQKCMQNRPEDRYQSCAELHYALEHYTEYGAAYRAKQKKKLRAFIATVSAMLLCLAVGVLGSVMRVRTNNLDYTQNLLWAEKATAIEDKIGFYSAAIDIKPTQTEAYFGLIDALKSDADFSVAEEQALQEKVNTNLTGLQEQPDYGRLSFEIGKLYWYYYSYGAEGGADNQITRMKSAIQWFDDAVNFGTPEDSFLAMASNYSDIGKFNRDITLNVAEASDKGTYAPYWENITALVENMDADESEIIQLEVYKLATYSIENYARKFKADGVEQYDMTALLEKVQEATKAVDTTSDTTEKLKNDLVKRFASAEAAIANAFRE